MGDEVGPFDRFAGWSVNGCSVRNKFYVDLSRDVIVSDGNAGRVSQQRDE